MRVVHENGEVRVAVPAGGDHTLVVNVSEKAVRFEMVYDGEVRLARTLAVDEAVIGHEELVDQVTRQWYEDVEVECLHAGHEEGTGSARERVPEKGWIVGSCA